MQMIRGVKRQRSRVWLCHRKVPSRRETSTTDLFNKFVTFGQTINLARYNFRERLRLPMTFGYLSAFDMPGMRWLSRSKEFKSRTRWSRGSRSPSFGTFRYPVIALITQVLTCWTATTVCPSVPQRGTVGNMVRDVLSLPSAAKPDSRFLATTNCSHENGITPQPS